MREKGEEYLLICLPPLSDPSFTSLLLFLLILSSSFGCSVVRGSEMREYE
jgi:hypothetical protein